MGQKTRSCVFFALIALNCLFFCHLLKAQGISGDLKQDSLLPMIDHIDELIASDPDSAYKLSQLLLEKVEDSQSLIYAELLVSTGNIYYHRGLMS
ncbi:hypothetical protein KFE98_17645 [bacterium SCSIO 12741]|nr:hypothetical protein KFE98_17645 [bacterium SCSIO 12741]